MKGSSAGWSANGIQNIAKPRIADGSGEEVDRSGSRPTPYTWWSVHQIIYSDRGKERDGWTAATGLPRASQHGGRGHGPVWQDLFESCQCWPLGFPLLIISMITPRRLRWAGNKALMRSESSTVWLEALKGTDNSKEVNGRVILKWTMDHMEIGLIWLGKGTAGGHLRKR
jgi:hypothetical protein